MMKRILITIVLTSIIGLALKAQTVPSPSETYLSLEVLNPVTLSDEILDTLTDPMSILTTSDTMLVSVSMILADTNVVTKIHIKLGSTLGGNDLLDQSYNYDDLNLILPQSYFREEEMVSLGLGEYLNSGVFYCEIKLEDSVGNFSEISTCQSDQ